MIALVNFYYYFLYCGCLFLLFAIISGSKLAKLAMDYFWRAYHIRVRKIFDFVIFIVGWIPEFVFSFPLVLCLNVLPYVTTVP